MNHYQIVTDSIVAALAAGTKPWSKPWQTKRGVMTDNALPFNVVSGKNYRGLNVPMLWGSSLEKGYDTHAWVSLKQANMLGGRVRKGEHSTWVYFLKQMEKDEDGDTVRFSMLRAYPVFNVAQCDGLKLPERAQPKPTESKGALGVVGPVVDRLKLEGGLRFGGESAFYTPSVDGITTPAVENFKSRDAFLATLLHECGHATGAKTRLARDFSGRFGDMAYAFEELVAELTSAFSQAALGLRADVENHASYIETWQRVLKQDRYAFGKACTLAQAATDLLLGVQMEAAKQAETAIA